jgi:septal ring factor EnvC (AmiA/AmiB activator)
MARRIIGYFVLAALLLTSGAALVGCGPKPPCEGADVTAVRAAQDQCAAATDELNAARDTRAGLEGDLASTQTEIKQLESQPAALSERLHELQKGSGR